MNKIATIVYECSHSLRADGIYNVIVCDGNIDVQDKIDDAKAEACAKYGDDWCLDDVWEFLDIDDYEIYNWNLAEV